jgi:hypothetical protein
MNMTSVDSENGKTEAQVLLNIALVKKRVDIGMLSEKEFDRLLHETLYSVDLHELRGFQELRTFLGQYAEDRESGITALIDEAFTLESSEVDPVFALDTHVLSVTRGVKNLVNTYKQHETGNMTHDHHVANEWGRTAYLFKSRADVLVLRRPRDRSYADENLATVSFEYEKVPGKAHHRINWAKVVGLPVANFRHFYGEKYPEQTRELIWELHTACERTHIQLVSQAESFERRHKELERLAGSIS